MEKQRPKSISLRELSKTVDAAAKVAAEKHGLTFEPGLVVDWTILGRILRALEGVDAGVANQAAVEVTKAVNTAHGEALRSSSATGGPEPALFGRRGILICGFIPGPIELKE